MKSHEDEGFGNFINQGSIGGIDNRVNLGSTGLVSSSGGNWDSCPRTAASGPDRQLKLKGSRTDTVVDEFTTVTQQVPVSLCP
jgi:hypothetical protein